MANVFMGGPQNKKKAQPTFGAQTNALGMGSSPQQKPNQQQVGTGFTNLNKLIGANVGEGSKLATGLGVSQGRQADQATQAQKDTKTNVQAGVDTATGLQTSATGLSTKIGSGSQGAADLSPEDIETAKKIASGEYGLDTTKDVYNTNMTKVGGLVGNVAGTNQNLQTEQGRSGLLSQYLRRPTQKSGLQALSNTLLQTEGQKQLQDLQKKSIEDVSKLGAGSADLQNYTKTLEDLTKGGSSITEAFKKTIGGTQAAMDAEEERQANAANYTNQKVMENIQTKLLNKQPLSGYEKDLLGITGDEFFGSNEQLANQVPSIITQNKVSAKDMYDAGDIRAYSNLAKILGQNPDSYVAGKGNQGLTSNKGGSAIVEGRKKEIASDIDKIGLINQPGKTGMDFVNDKGAGFNQYRQSVNKDTELVTNPDTRFSDAAVDTLVRTSTAPDKATFKANLSMAVKILRDPNSTPEAKSEAMGLYNQMSKESVANLSNTSNKLNSQWTQLSNLFKNYNVGGF